MDRGRSTGGAASGGGGAEEDLWSDDRQDPGEQDLAVRICHLPFAICHVTSPHPISRPVRVDAVAAGAAGGAQGFGHGGVAGGDGGEAPADGAGVFAGAEREGGGAVG